jgi:hypothetical protein
MRSCARELRRWETTAGPLSSVRDLGETTPARSGERTFFHPAMQQVALEHAIASGAEVRRGASVRAGADGAHPSVQVEVGGELEELRAPLIVVAVGRGSFLPAAFGFEYREQPAALTVAGMLLDGADLAGASSARATTGLSCASKPGCGRSSSRQVPSATSCELRPCHAWRRRPISSGSGPTRGLLARLSAPYLAPELVEA